MTLDFDAIRWASFAGLSLLTVCGALAAFYDLFEAVSDPGILAIWCEEIAITAAIGRTCEILINRSWPRRKFDTEMPFVLTLLYSRVSRLWSKFGRKKGAQIE